MRCRPVAAFVIVACLGPLARPAVAAEPHPEVVADFTRRVQPLLLNRCATGGCHGDPGAGGLRFVHRDFTGRITREITLGNIEAILAACSETRSAAGLIATTTSRHPKSATSPHEFAQPLSPRERSVLEGWLNTALAAGDANASRPSAPLRPPSRFQKLLDEAANPTALPPPPKPKGLLIPEDDGAPPGR